MGWKVEKEGVFVPYGRWYSKAFEEMLGPAPTPEMVGDMDNEYRKFMEVVRGDKGSKTHAWYGVELDGEWVRGLRLKHGGQLVEDSFLWAKDGMLNGKLHGVVGNYLLSSEGNYQYIASWNGGCPVKPGTIGLGAARGLGVAQEVIDEVEKELGIDENRFKVHQPFDNPREVLEKLVGLKEFKKQVFTWMNREKVKVRRKALGKYVEQGRDHIVFVGPPGTGKTTCARICGSLMKESGRLEKGHVVEISREEVIGEYQGHTEAATKAAVLAALDGVLLIDEAYAFFTGKGDSFGKIFIDILVKLMEDYKDRLVVIVTGYDKEMTEWFKVNTGIKGRFVHWFRLVAYTMKELAAIFKLMLEKWELINQDEVEIEPLMENIQDNARGVEIFFQTVLDRQANRLTVDGNIDDELLDFLTEADFKEDAECVEEA